MNDDVAENKRTQIAVQDHQAEAFPDASSELRAVAASAGPSDRQHGLIRALDAGRALRDALLPSFAWTGVVLRIGPQDHQEIRSALESFGVALMDLDAMGPDSEGAAAHRTALRFTTPGDSNAVELIGIKNGVEHSLGTIRMPAMMKAKELVSDYLGPFEENDASEADMALCACRELVAYMEESVEPLVRVDAAVPPANGEPSVAAIEAGRLAFRRIMDGVEPDESDAIASAYRAIEQHQAEASAGAVA